MNTNPSETQKYTPDPNGDDELFGSPVDEGEEGDVLSLAIESVLTGEKQIKYILGSDTSVEFQ